MRSDRIRGIRLQISAQCCLAALCCLALSFACPLTGLAQKSSSGKSDPLSSIPFPRSWLVDVVNNEMEVLNHKGSYLRYRMHTVNARGDTIRDVIESEDGTVARLILRDGKPLTDERDKAERSRLNDILQSPAEFQKHVREGDSGKKIADSLMHMMPDAMIYTLTPGQPQTGRNPGRKEVVFDYEPNPKFEPPTTMSEALRGLKGRVWIDEKGKHLVRMEGNIFRGVNFGWGLLAHIYPGGQLALDQVDVGNGRWTFSHFSEHISARVLVKTVTINTTVDASNFQAVPAMKVQDAIRVLLNTPLPKN